MVKVITHSSVAASSPKVSASPLSWCFRLIFVPVTVATLAGISAMSAAVSEGSRWVTVGTVRFLF